MSAPLIGNQLTPLNGLLVWSLRDFFFFLFAMDFIDDLEDFFFYSFVSASSQFSFQQCRDNYTFCVYTEILQAETALLMLLAA